MCRNNQYVTVPRGIPWTELPLPHNPEILTTLLKTGFEILWEEKKYCFKTAFSSFSHNVFYPFYNEFQFSMTLVLDKKEETSVNFVLWLKVTIEKQSKLTGNL